MRNSPFPGRTGDSIESEEEERRWRRDDPPRAMRWESRWSFVRFAATGTRVRSMVRKLLPGAVFVAVGPGDLEVEEDGMIMMSSVVSIIIVLVISFEEYLLAMLRETHKWHTS